MPATWMWFTAVRIVRTRAAASLRRNEETRGRRRPQLTPRSSCPWNIFDRRARPRCTGRSTDTSCAVSVHFINLNLAQSAQSWTSRKIDAPRSNRAGSQCWDGRWKYASGPRFHFAPTGQGQATLPSHRPSHINKVTAYQILPSFHELFVDDLTCIHVPSIDVDGLSDNGIRPAAKHPPGAILQSNLSQSCLSSRSVRADVPDTV
jgi:hypothetical protein